MTNFIIILFVIAIVGLASLYVYKQKKNGSKCIGCPHCKSCKKNTCK